MPTKRQRHMVTESDRLAAALDDAARRWPADGSNRAALLLRLVEVGHQAITAEQDAEVQGRREAIARTSGALTGVFGEDYLEELRGEWPE